MELHRGYCWVREKGGSWTIGLVEKDGDEARLTLFGNDSSKNLNDVKDGELEAVRIFNPDAVREHRKQREEERHGRRRPMTEIRPLYFVVQPERHEEQIRYVAQDELSTAAQEAVRISHSSPGKALYVMEAHPIGKVRDGRMEQL